MVTKLEKNRKNALTFEVWEAYKIANNTYGRLYLYNKNTNADELLRGGMVVR